MRRGLRVGWGLLAAVTGGQAWAETDGLQQGELASPPPVVSREAARTKGVTPEGIDAAGLQQFQNLLAIAKEKKALAPANHPQQVRLEQQLQRVLSLPLHENLPRAAQWKWEVALIGVRQVNAFGLPPGKLIVYTGMLDKLQPSDDELVSLIATLVARLLLDQQRELVNRSAQQQLGAALVSEMTKIPPEVAKAGAGISLRAFKRQQVLSSDALARKLLDGLGIPLAAQIGLIERSMRLAAAPSSAESDFPRLEARLAQLNGAAK